MIDELYVKDYVLFDKTNVEFEPGMTVITGETGAGKSLLIDAINLIRGQRAQKNCIRKGSSKAVLQMHLSNLNDRQKAMLEENDFDAEEDLFIQRSLSETGKSSIKINGQPSTLSFVRDFVSHMVDVHSQMDTYQLMNTSVQLDLLDQYAKTSSLRDEVNQAYIVYSKNRQAFNKAKEETYSEDALEFATMQFNEIEEAHIEEGELDSLTKRIKVLANAQKNLEQLSDSIYALDHENGVLDGLYIVKKALKEETVPLDLENLYYQLSDLCDSLKAKRELLQRDMEDIDRLKEREYFIKRLYRKHGGTHASMMEAKKRYLDRIDQIIHRQDVLEKLEKDLINSQQAYMRLATKLSEKRQAVFKELSNQIEMHCKDLMLEHAKFQIQRKEKEASKDGIDEIEFMVSMNTGQPFSELKASASGGELSRLMLALKVVFQSQQGIETIVFDEIDTGVSGKVAFAMGQKMKRLSKDYQVLCITHLASVAAWADHHLRVQKETDENSTVTHVQVLDQEQSIEELAMMASGEVSSASLLAAKELKDRVQHG